MSQTNIKYSRTIFYRIVCRDLNIKDCFVGNTFDFRRRLYDHKCKSEHSILNGPNSMLYYFVRRHGGWQNFEMILINTQACEGVLDVRRIKSEYIKEFNAGLQGPMRPLPDVKQEEPAASNISEQATTPPKKTEKGKQTEAVEVVALTTRVDELPKQPKQTKPSKPPNVLAPPIEGRPDTSVIRAERRRTGWQDDVVQCVACNCYVNKYQASRHNTTNKHKKALATEAAEVFSFQYPAGGASLIDTTTVYPAVPVVVADVESDAINNVVLAE